MIRIDGHNGISEIEGTIAELMAEFTLGLRELYHAKKIDNEDLETMVKLVKTPAKTLRDDFNKSIADALLKGIKNGDPEAIECLKLLMELAETRQKGDKK